MKAVTFKDRVQIHVSAGNGGDGCASFRREKFVPRGGPNGGDGGRGGDVYLTADKNADSLLDLYFRPHQRAEHGGRGRSKDCHGLNGADLFVKVPCGTVIRDLQEDRVVGELLADGDRVVVARGGAAGLGNSRFVSSINQAPTTCTEGEPGEVKKLGLELKIVADVGMVGYPNAGKSTLLSKLSDAHPKVAAYPFTTLNPIIGTVIYDDYQRLRVADIPGLIEGAHAGVGLGHDFLRHIERTTFLLFVIDMAGVDGRNPGEDYLNLRRELTCYREELGERPFRVVANKMDLPEAQTQLGRFKKDTGQTPIEISAEQNLGVDKVSQALHEYFFEGR